MSRLLKKIAFFKDKRGLSILILLVLIALLIIGILFRWYEIPLKDHDQEIGNAHQMTGRTMNELCGMGEDIVKIKSAIIEKVTAYENQSKDEEERETVMNHSETEIFKEEGSVVQNSEEGVSSGGYQEWHDRDGMIWNGGEVSPDDYDWDQIGW